MDHVDAVVIGAGVVGLACARSLSLAGLETIAIERAGTIGAETSSRNSEVIHAGMYYPTNSLKASACVAGRSKLYAYCADRGVPHKRIGKLIVATDEGDVAQLAAIAKRARDNGINDNDALIALSAAEARVLEPALQCVAALYSPSTGIVDSHALMLSYEADLEAAGGLVLLGHAAVNILISDGRFEIEVAARDGSISTLSCRYVVNSAGHRASDVAKRIHGLNANSVPETFLSRGCYFTATGQIPFRHLIYPIPNEVTAGIHLTIDLAGRAKFGPDHEWISVVDHTVDPNRCTKFYHAIRRYYPGLPDGTLQPGYAGVRPKLQRPGEKAKDFVIQGPLEHGIAGLVNLYGIESPGLTSSLALADMVSERFGLLPQIQT